MFYRGDNMSVFLQRFIQDKKYFLIVITTTIIMGFLFGFYQYKHTQPMIQQFFHSFFYFNIENYQNHYQLYLIQSGIMIFICTYLSTSYMGQIGLLFICFLKGLQISFSIQYVVMNVQIQFMIILLMLCEIILELMIVYVITYIGLYISCYVTLVNFYIEQNFHIQSILNYRLNFIIATLIILTLSLAFRLYVVPLF